MVAVRERVYAESHHLSEDFGVFGPGEGSVRDPAWHQALVGVGSRPLHLRHHRLLVLLLGGKDMKARPTVLAPKQLPRMTV